MLVKRLKGEIDREGKLLLNLSDIPPGEVEVIIFKKENKKMSQNNVLSQIPKHSLGKIFSTLRREDIYNGIR